MGKGELTRAKKKLKPLVIAQEVLPHHHSFLWVVPTAIIHIERQEAADFL